MISAKALFKINAYNKCLRVVESLEAHWHPMQNIPGKRGDTCSEMKQGHSTHALAAADLKTGGSH